LRARTGPTLLGDTLVVGNSLASHINRRGDFFMNMEKIKPFELLVEAMIVVWLLDTIFKPLLRSSQQGLRAKS
jgi:hypothetical protein